MHELCLTNLSLVDADPPALIDAAASAGFASVTLWLATPSAFAPQRRHIAPALGDPAALATIRERLAATGLALFTVAGTMLSEEHDRVLIGRTVAAAAELEAQSIAVTAWDCERNRVTEAFAFVCAAAEDVGLDVHLEFIPSSAVPTLRDAVDVVTSAGAPNGKVIVDAVHLARSGGNPQDVAQLSPALIGSLQLSDAAATPPPLERRHEETLAGRRYPGDGELPLKALICAVPAGTVLEIESPVAADAHHSFGERARRCADAARRILGDMAVYDPALRRRGGFRNPTETECFDG